ncbi:MAG: DUF1552 domain-containing protein [Myxococcales bacterium]|nr:DUF1552 domain-containing protein [Myxococcales bacterium]
MARSKISRRTVLKGLLGGAAVSVALPPLEAFMNSSGTAWADKSPFPTRFGIWYWGNGNLPAKWAPAGEGPDWMPSPQLMPLASLRKLITVVSGMSVQTANTVPHGSGPAGLLSGDDMKNDTFSRPSIDQLIAASIGGSTRFASLEVGVQRANKGISHTGPNQVNPPETSPRALFDRLFGAGFRAPGDMSKPDPKLALRRSVLDAVTLQAGRLKTRLGATDRSRLDQHLDGIRQLEKQIDALGAAPQSLAACAKPAAPKDDYPDVEGRAQLSAISRVVSDLVAMALACDQTRVFTNMFSQPVNNLLFPSATEGHHQLTHDEAGDQPQVDAIVVSIIAELAYFLGALQKVQEGAGTLLDHSVVLATSDVSLGRTHSLLDYPILLAGGANGALKTGLHYRSKSSENATRVTLTLLRVLGVHATEFGVGPGRVTGGLDAIVV